VRGNDMTLAGGAWTTAGTICCRCAVSASRVLSRGGSAATPIELELQLESPFRRDNPGLGSPFNRSWFPASTGGPGQASPDWAGALVGVEA
jgi:hypothetical protein